MYSKVKVAGHPLHPMLVGIPVTLYVVTLAGLVACALGASMFWFDVALYANLAGVIMAAVAAVAGFIDWALGVPSGVSAKSTGLSHMATNVGALLLFALNVLSQWGHRHDLVVPALGLSLALCGLGVVLTIIAGFLGWKMVQVHHVGIDLSPEQQRLEPRPTPRIEHEHPGHGQRAG